MEDKPLSYAAIHHWVIRELGQPKKCQYCEKEYRGQNMHWANLSGEYKEDLTDWLRLCRWCHRKYDSRNWTWDGKEWHNMLVEKRTGKFIQIKPSDGLTPEIHKQIKVKAIDARKTMGEYILDCVKTPPIQLGNYADEMKKQGFVETNYPSKEPNPTTCEHKDCSMCGYGERSMFCSKHMHEPKEEEGSLEFGSSPNIPIDALDDWICYSCSKGYNMSEMKMVIDGRGFFHCEDCLKTKPKDFVKITPENIKFDVEVNPPKEEDETPTKEVLASWDKAKKSKHRIPLSKVLEEFKEDEDYEQHLKEEAIENRLIEKHLGKDEGSDQITQVDELMDEGSPNMTYEKMKDVDQSEWFEGKTKKLSPKADKAILKKLEEKRKATVCKCSKTYTDPDCKPKKPKCRKSTCDGMNCGSCGISTPVTKPKCQCYGSVHIKECPKFK